jgi:alkanesulfonate monooxygenase SsuD/methylene tetrahydromethanopterin reductase-like flavin-dependent oxidoreductase (luciferase family)
MYYGIDLPTTGEYADVRTLAALAAEAESAGWDGFFIYDQVASDMPEPIADTGVALAAIALGTERIRFGALVTPLARRRPWKVARETVTLDQLSGGRLVVGVGLGGGATEFDDLGEAGEPQMRAAMLDEGLEVLAGLWRGEPFSYSGRHYQLREALFQPPPVQSPRIPIWVGGVWPSRAPFRRAARWDGVFPHYRGAAGPSMMPPQALRELLAFVTQQRAAGPFDVVLRNKAPSDDRAEQAETIAAYAAAGLTWWLEGVERHKQLAPMRAYIRQGPPRC